MKKTTKMVKVVAANMLITVLSITCIFPIIWTLYPSLKTDEEFSLDILDLPKHLMFENYTRAITEENISTYFVDSMFDTAITVRIVIVISFMTGYYLSRFKLRDRTLAYYMFLSRMLIPIYALLIPIFTEFKTLGLLNKKYTLILPYIALVLPMRVFLVESSVTSAPIEIEEIVCIDGSSSSHTMFAIVMPMCKLVLSICTILTLLSIWNESPLALVLARSNTPKTMPIGLTDSVGSYTVNYPLMLAALVVSTLPMVIMYLLFYNQIMKGIIVGAVRG